MKEQEGKNKRETENLDRTGEEVTHHSQANDLAERVLLGLADKEAGGVLV